jgi:hypothetical protein
VMNDYANTGNQILETMSLGLPMLAVDDGVNSGLFGDCPHALFVAPQRLPEVDAETIRGLISSRGAYRSKHLMGWPERMRKEIAWVERL